MLVIRKKQIAILQDHMRELFVQRTLASLKSLYPDYEEIEDESAMRKLIDHGIEAARAYGVDREREVSLFIFLMPEHGREFYRGTDRPWIKDILRDPELNQEEKMDMLYERLSSSEQLSQ